MKIIGLCAALAFLASCAASSLVTQKKNPDYTGKPFKTILVVAVTSDEIVRRTFEDRIVARLGQRGRKGIPGYVVVGKRGKITEAELREAITQSGAEGVLVTRVTGVDTGSVTVPGAEVTIGYGWGGFYGYYAGVWETAYIPSQQVSGSSSTLTETRLFDAKSGVLVWTGVVRTGDGNNLDAVLSGYVELIFDAMESDRVI